MLTMGSETTEPSLSVHSSPLWRRPHEIDDEWDGVVSDEEPYVYTGSDDSSNGGILILPGPDGAREEQPLSLPGTESLPTDIGSLRDPMMGSSIYQHSRASRISRLHSLEEEERRSKLSYLLLLIIMGLSVASSCYLLWERNMWHASQLRLEEQIRQIQTKLDKPKHHNPPPPRLTIWDDACHDSNEQTPLVDNCWLHANVQLGECASQAKKNVQTQVKKLGKSAWKTSKRFMGHVDEWSKNLYAEHFVDNKNTTTTEERNGFSWKGTAKTVFSGVAFATLAAVVAEESVSFFSKLANDKDN